MNSCVHGDERIPKQKAMELVAKRRNQYPNYKLKATQVYEAEHTDSDVVPAASDRLQKTVLSANGSGFDWSR